MILDYEVFEQHYRPDDLLHRHDELSMLATVFDPLSHTPATVGAFVYGPSGVGKTTVAHYLLDDQLAATYPTIETVYVDAWDLRTRAGVLRSILAAVSQADPSMWQGDGIDSLVRALRDLDGPLVVVLDEADRLDDPEACRDLIDAPTITPLVIANSQDTFLARLDERVRSRLSRLRAVKFDHYSVSELVAILEDRISAGVRPGAIGRTELERIADHAAGDAREALAILYHALLDAEAQEADCVTPDIIDAAVPDARESIVEDVLASLREAQLQLVHALADVGPAQMGTVREAFSERVDDLPSDRTLRNWFEKLREYEVVQFDDSGRYRNYELTDEALVVLGGQ